jgi:hypothetical protein
MNANCGNKTLTLDGFDKAVSDSRDNERARGIAGLAVHAQAAAFRGSQHFVIPDRRLG